MIIWQIVNGLQELKKIGVTHLVINLIKFNMK